MVACWFRTATYTRSSESDLTVVSKRQPDAAEIQDLMFAWSVTQFVKSNAIVYCKNPADHRDWRRPDEQSLQRAKLPA